MREISPLMVSKPGPGGIQPGEEARVAVPGLRVRIGGRVCAAGVALEMNAAPTPAGAPGPTTDTEPDTEAGLRLFDCKRCGEPMYHRCHLEAEYPLCWRWAFECGECGQRVDTWEHAWEDKPVPWHTATYRDGYAVEQVRGTEKPTA